MHIPRIFYEAIAFLYLVDVETKFARVLFHDLNGFFQIFQVPLNTAKAEQKKNVIAYQPSETNPDSTQEGWKIGRIHG